MLALVVVLVLSLSVLVIAWRDHGPEGAIPGGASRPDREIAYSQLEVVERGGRFHGRIELANNTEVHANVWVQVHMYVRDQEVGQLSGSISLKPHSDAQVELDSSDTFQNFTDAVVEVLPVPANVR